MEEREPNVERGRRKVLLLQMLLSMMLPKRI
jgi:hypothetical protein